MAALILIALMAGSAYWELTAHVFRTKKCRRCRGLGFIPAGLLSGLLSSYKPCGRCQGYGRVHRTAARHVARRRQRAGRPSPRR
jgi:DnaJ-class molecular chaperone